jgi:hypothetical protein
MANQSVATDNAKVLQDFFAKLKVDEVADSVAFTLVTGITRYALTSMDSGANHLNDISLESKYAGICGFTIPEFDALFADRMEDTLISLQQSGEMSPGASLRDLRAEIFDWYDGYNWGGETRVLNPFSILNFFDKKVFYAYWIQSGRPDHLTALIKTRPWDFIDLKLDSYLATTVRKSELTQLETAPVLFHSGYLTIDKTLKIPGLDYKSKKKFLRGYSFRLPNYEVSSSYYDECFKLLRLSTLELTAKKEELLSAFKAKDGQTVSSILSSYFGAVTFYQKPKSESSFHVFVQLILKAMDFTVDSELAGAAGRLDIGVRLSNHSYLIIELRYCPETNKLTENEINQILAATAKTKLPIDLYNESLASMIASKLGREKLDIALSKIGLPKPTVEDYNQFLANNAKEYLTPTEIDQTLAQTLKDELPKEDIEKILKKAQSTTKDSNEKIDALLAKTAQEALDDIQKRDYPSIVSFHANEITSLGLAIYGNGTKIVALFNPNLSEETLIT